MTRNNEVFAHLYEVKGGRDFTCLAGDDRYVQCSMWTSLSLTLQRKSIGLLWGLNLRAAYRTLT